MSPAMLTLSLLRDTLAICRLDGRALVPNWAEGSSFLSLTRTADELSLVCSRAVVPEGVTGEAGWRCLRVAGPLGFGLTGILASLAVPLAAAGVSLFAISTYDTDYLLVREADLERAVQALRGAGHEVNANAAQC